VKPPLRCVVVTPAPAPYREPLFASLAQRLELCVVYQSAAQPSWDVAPSWFAVEHPYPARHLRAWQRGRPGRTPIVWPRGLERALKAADPDCVVVSEYGFASLRALAWCRRRGRAHVVLTECTPQIDGMLPAPQLILHRLLARNADGVIAVSGAARRRLEAFGVPSERITVALQAADLEPVRAAAMSRRPHREGALRVLSVGRLVPDKNLASLIDAFADAGLSEDQARLQIVGSGPLEAALRQRAAHRGVPVQFEGHLDFATLPGRYAEADIFALVSTYEPFGVAVREAAAAGLPLVCSRRAGAAGDVAVDGRNAFLVDPERVDEITAALVRLVSDEPLRRQMGAQSRAIDLAADGSEVDAFARAVGAATRRRGRGGGVH
jgi:glycosyltransferase involved in cell wall biosynthesis